MSNYCQGCKDRQDRIDALEAENKRLTALYEIAVGNIAFNSDDLDKISVRAMIERHYEDTQKEAQHAS